MPVSGKGDAPLRSAWMFRGQRGQARGSMMLRGQMRFEDRDTSEKTIFVDWFFGQPANTLPPIVFQPQVSLVNRRRFLPI